MSDQFKFVQAQPFTLAGAGATIGDTSITLSSFKQIDGTTNLTMSDFGAKGFLTLEPNSGTQEEQVVFTNVVQNASGTATLTGVSSVSFTSPYTETSGLAKTHAGGTIAIVSNTSGFYNSLTGKADDETITGTWTFTASPIVPTGGTGTQAANATDIANAITGVSGTATNLVAGTTKLSVAAASAPNPIAVGNNDNRVSPVSLASLTADEVAALAGTGTPSSGNKYVTADTDALKQLLSNLSTSGSLGSSDTLYPSQKAVKTYVDALPTYISEQVIAYMNGTVVNTAANAYITSTSDGTALFLVTQGTNTSSVRITRFAKDTGTGQYYISHTTTLATTSFGGVISAAVAGNYLYVALRDNGSSLLERYDKADLANATVMTVSGTGFGANPISMFSDGTNLYVYNNTAGTYGKYSISGTTATFVTTIVYTSAGAAGAICDGTNVWITDGTGSTAGTLTIKKYVLAGGAATSTTTPIAYIAAFANPSIVSLLLYNSTKLGIAFAYTIGTTVTGQVLKINTITLP